MPRVKKKSYEYGNRRRRKLAAAKRSVHYYPLMVDGVKSVLQTTGEMPPTPPLTSPDTDDLKSDNDFKNQDAFPKKIENHDSKPVSFNTAGIKTERIEEYQEYQSEIKTEKIEGYRAIRPIKGLSDLISKSIITAEDAATAVSAVTSIAALKKTLAGRKGKILKQPKQPKQPKQTSVKVSLPPSKVPVLPKPPTTPNTTTAAPNKLMVNFKGLGNTASSGNTQKAYALYVGGQLKYILPYNGPLGAINSVTQQNNEMKKLICRGVNGKTEIALAKPTVVCDEEKKKIVFVVQKKATTGPSSSLLTGSNQTTNRSVKIPSLSTLSTTSGHSLQGNHIISDNMLKLLLPAVSASINSNSPISLPSTVSLGGQEQKTRTSPQQTPQNQPAPTEKVPASSIPIVVKVPSSVGQSMSTATTTTTTITTTSSSPTSSPTTTTTAMTNVTPQTSPVSSSSNSPGSVRPVQLFTRDSARNLCPTPLVLTPGSKPCMTILDPTDPGANIRPGKSLLGNSETSPSVGKQSTYQGEIPASANQILVKKTSGDNSVILQFKDATGVPSFMSASDKDPKHSDQSSNFTNNAQIQQTVTPVSVPNSTRTETMPVISATASEEDCSANDEDDGMFGLKISSVFSLADNQPCPTADESVTDQETKLGSNSPPASFQQDQIPADTLATAMKLAVTPEKTKSNNADGGGSSPNQRTVIFSMNTDNISSQSQQDNLQIMFDTSPSKQNSLLKSSVAKSSVNVKLEPQSLASFDPDLESVLTGKLSVDTQTVHSQKENASPKKAASLVGPEKDFLPGQKYITVDIFRHNGQTKVTAVASSSKKDVTKPSLPNGNSEGASASSSDDNKSSISTSDPRINEVLQCAAYSLPMGTYFFIPLADKIVAIPSQRRKKNRSAYIFEKNHNFMQVKMAKYMLLNSKDKLPTSIVTSTNGAQLVCQVNTSTKKNGEPTIVLPAPSASSAKDSIPTLEAPPIVTGKRIRRPKKHTGFEEDMDLIPPLRKCRKKLKPVNKTEKYAKEPMYNDKNSQPVDSKEELAAVLRSVDLPTTIPKNNNATSLPYGYVHPLKVNVNPSKVATSASSTNETSLQSSNQSGLQIDNVQSLQQEGIKIKSEPITSGYGDEEPIKPPCPLLTPAPSVASSVQVDHNALDLLHTIKKEPSWYGYGQETSSTPVIYRMNTSTSTSHSDHMSTVDINLKKHKQPPASYKKDSPTKSPTGKKRGRKKKEPDETKPEVKKRKYVRHKIETVTTPTQTPHSILMSTHPSFPLKTEMKTEPPDPTVGSSNQSGETPQEERIRRLKEILREKEQKLEEIRLNMSVSATI